MKATLKRSIEVAGRTYVVGTACEVIENKGIYATVILDGLSEPITVGVADVVQAYHAVPKEEAERLVRQVLEGKCSVRLFLQLLGEEHPDQFLIFLVSLFQEVHESSTPQGQVVRRLFRLLNDEAAVQHWLRTCHPALDGQTPLEVIRNGQADRVLKLVDKLDGEAT